MSSSDQGDNLTDDELQSEIELVGDLVVAATSNEGPLTQDQIDQLLGVVPTEAGAGASAGTPAGADAERAPAQHRASASTAPSDH